MHTTGPMLCAARDPNLASGKAAGREQAWAARRGPPRERARRAGRRLLRTSALGRGRARGGRRGSSESRPVNNIL